MPEALSSTTASTPPATHSAHLTTAPRPVDNRALKIFLAAGLGAIGTWVAVQSCFYGVAVFGVGKALSWLFDGTKTLFFDKSEHLTFTIDSRIQQIANNVFWNRLFSVALYTSIGLAMSYGGVHLLMNVSPQPLEQFLDAMVGTAVFVIGFSLLGSSISEARRVHEFGKDTSQLNTRLGALHTALKQSKEKNRPLPDKLQFLLFKKHLSPFWGSSPVKIEDLLKGYKEQNDEIAKIQEKDPNSQLKLVEAKEYFEHFLCILPDKQIDELFSLYTKDHSSILAAMFTILPIDSDSWRKYFIPDVAKIEENLKDKNRDLGKINQQLRCFLNRIEILSRANLPQFENSQELKQLKEAAEKAKEEIKNKLSGVPLCQKLFPLL